MPRFRLSTKTFIQPNLYPEGAVIDYTGPVGPQFEPLDDAAQEMIDQYYAKNPGVSLHAIGAINHTEEPPPLPEVKLVSVVVNEPEIPVINLKSEPGPTELGGKIAEDKKPKGKDVLVEHEHTVVEALSVK